MKDAQAYDKILKENMEALLPNLLTKVLKLKYKALEEIPDDIQTTIERRPDFLKKVTPQQKGDDYILHLEFQTKNDSKMVKRMLEYKALLHRKHELDILQYVIFIGNNPSIMETELKLYNLQFNFNLINMIDIPYQYFLNSKQPEDLVLAILANFGSDSGSIVINKVIKHLEELNLGTLDKQKAVIQIEILSHLRNLQEEITKQLIDYLMAIDYDIKKSILYKKGIEQGIEQEREENIKALLREELLNPQQIAKVLKVDLEKVLALAEEVEKASKNNTKLDR